MTGKKPFFQSIAQPNRKTRRDIKITNSKAIGKLHVSEGPHPYIAAFQMPPRKRDSAKGKKKREREGKQRHRPIRKEIEDR